MVPEGGGLKAQEEARLAALATWCQAWKQGLQCWGSEWARDKDRDLQLSHQQPE